MSIFLGNNGVVIWVSKRILLERNRYLIFIFTTWQTQPPYLLYPWPSLPRHTLFMCLYCFSGLKGTDSSVCTFLQMCQKKFLKPFNGRCIELMEGSMNIFSEHASLQLSRSFSMSVCAHSIVQHLASSGSCWSTEWYFCQKRLLTMHTHPY